MGNRAIYIIAEKFTTNGVGCVCAEVSAAEILREKEIVRLLNLINNPSYTHLEDTDFEAGVPTRREHCQRDDEQDRQAYADLAFLPCDIAEGSDSFIWNGKSTITANCNSPDSQFIVLDTNALQETNDSIKRTQYFNIRIHSQMNVPICWEQMSRNREERVLLICDEVYLMIDQKVPQSLVYLRNVMKKSSFVNKAPKYEGALGIISHSVIDFLSEEHSGNLRIATAQYFFTQHLCCRLLNKTFLANWKALVFLQHGLCSKPTAS